jgi:hypothetical protein
MILILHGLYRLAMRQKRYAIKNTGNGASPASNAGDSNSIPDHLIVRELIIIPISHFDKGTRLPLSTQVRLG